MKKMALFLVMTLTIFRIFANTLPPSPYLMIEQFRITSSTDWTLKIFFYWDRPTSYSITISCLAGSSNVTNLSNYYSAGTDMWILNVSPASLNQPLQINSTEDFINVTGYNSSYPNFTFNSEITFGNVNNAMVLAPLLNQAIILESSDLSYYPDVYSLDNTPSSNGLPLYDTAGTCGIMHGIVYGTDLHPYPDGSFYWDFHFTTDANGNYSTPIYGRNVYTDVIKYYMGTIKTATIVPISYFMEPDSTIYRDIYLLDMTGFNQMSDTSGFLIYPDRENDLIIIKIPQTLSAKGNAYLRLMDLTGRCIRTFQLDLNNMIQKFPVNISHGAYIAAIIQDGIVVSTEKFIE